MLEKDDKKKLWVSFLVILVVLILDQSLKIWVKTHMLQGEDSYINWNWPLSWARLHFIENPGMAFGLVLPGHIGKLILSIFRLVLVGLLIFVLLRNYRKFTLSIVIFLSLIIAGALGNLIDSAFYGLIFSSSPYYGVGVQPAHFVKFGHGYAPFLMGYVVDMLYFPLCDCVIPHWVPILGGREFLFFRPIFNIADSAITIGAFGLILFNKKLKSSYGKNRSDN